MVEKNPSSTQISCRKVSVGETRGSSSDNESSEESSDGSDDDDDVDEREARRSHSKLLIFLVD